MIRTLKEAIEAREAFPGKVRIARELRWFAQIDGSPTYELLPDRELEDVSRYIDEQKAGKTAKDARIAELEAALARRDALLRCVYGLLPIEAWEAREKIDAELARKP
jgi:hypothetical protein